jgi:hypothetical protein
MVSRLVGGVQAGKGADQGKRTFKGPSGRGWAAGAGAEGCRMASVPCCSWLHGVTT